MEKLIGEFSLGLFIWQSVVFVVLIFLLGKFAWKPILNAVEERESKISDALDAAEKAKADIAKLKQQNDEMRQSAIAEREALLKEAKETKETIIAEGKATAKIEADRILTSAREDIKAEQMAAVTEMKNQVALLSIEIAEKIVKKQLDTDDSQKTLVNSLIEDARLN